MADPPPTPESHRQSNVAPNEPVPVAPAPDEPAPNEPASVAPGTVTPAAYEPAQVAPAAVAPAPDEPAPNEPAVTPAAYEPAPNEPAVTPAAYEPAQVAPAAVTPAATEPAPTATTQIAPGTAAPAQLAPDMVDIPTSGRIATPDPTGRTRLSGTWVGVIIAALVLTLLLVFILQNTKSVKISYFNAVVAMPLGVALLLAAIGGILLAGVIASMRIWQLRHRLNVPGNPAGRGRRTRRATTRQKSA